MLETPRFFLSQMTNPTEVQRWTATLEALLSDKNRPNPVEWVQHNLHKLEPDFLLALIDIMARYMYEKSLESTFRLIYLDTLVIGLVFSRLADSQDNEFLQQQLLEVMTVLEENAVGPRTESREPSDVYKRLCNYRGCCLAEQGDYIASIEHFNVTLSLDPYFAPAYCNRARAYLELNRLEEAEQDCATMRTFDPGYSIGQATSQLVATLTRLKQRRPGTAAELAQEHGLLELLRTYDRPLKPRETYLALDRQINPLEMPGEPGPDATTDEINHYGVVLGRSGDYQGAIEAFSRTLQVDPTYMRAYYNRAKAYVLINEYEKAIADFSAILERIPQDTETQQLLTEAQAKWQNEQQKQAGSVIALSSEQATQAARNEAREGDEEEQNETLSQADRISRFRHQHEQALDLVNSLDKANLKIQETLPARRRLQQASILERLHQTENALAAYKEAMAMLSGTKNSALMITSLEGMGRCLLANSQIEDARDYWHQASRLAQANHNITAQERICHQLGALEETAGDLEQARSMYEQAEELARQNNNWGGVFAALTKLADLTARLGQLDEQQRLAAACHQLHNEWGELVYAGPTALPFPLIIRQAQQILDLADIGEQQVDMETATQWYEQATNLRKSKQYEASLAPYYSALKSFLQMNHREYIPACLNGLGISYTKLTDKNLVQERKDFWEKVMQDEAPDDDHVIKLNRIFLSNTLQVYDLFYKPIGELAEKARACHRWILELDKETGDLAGQANQIGNLAILEENLGNLYTAHRYHHWALQVHLQEQEREDAAIGLINMAYIEECLGDPEAGAAKRKRAKELRDAG